MRVAAIDLGGTRCKAAAIDVVDGVATVVDRLRPVDVSGRSADHALQVAADLIGQAHGEVAGIALPGLHEDGLVVALPGKFPGMEGLDVRKRLQYLTGLSVFSANDAISAAVGEAVGGAGRGVDRMIMITIGTGVGTCIVDGGQPVGDGRLGGGILGGQIPISAPEGAADTSGNRGTIEARCHAERILTHALEAGSSATTVIEVLDRAAHGEVEALAGISAWQQWMARGIVALVHAHGTGTVVIGGGPVRGGTPLLDGLAERVADGVWPGVHVDIRPAALGDDAGLVGIACLTKSSSLPSSDATTDSGPS